MGEEDIEDIIVIIFPLIIGASIYIGTGDAVSAIAWTVCMWFCLAVGRALDRFHP